MEELEIINYLKDRDYDELIKKLNIALDKEENQMYYYYRFLAYNQDYLHIDFNDIKDAIDLNKVFDLDIDLTYSVEYNFFKLLPSHERKIFAYLLRSDIENFNILMEYFDVSILSNDKIFNLLKKFVMNMNDYKQIKSLEMLFKLFLQRKNEISNNSLISHINSIIKYLESRLLDISPVEFIINDGILMGVKLDNIDFLKIPNTVKIIDDYACQNLYNLVNVVIPNSVTIIGKNAFRDCKKLKNVIVPDSVVDIKIGAFSKCSNLESITIPIQVFYNPNTKERKTFGYFFGDIGYDDSDIVKQTELLPKNKFGTKKYYLPNKLKEVIITNGNVKEGLLPIYAFENCKLLTSIKLPNNLKTIEVHAFKNCFGLDTITIPDSVNDAILPIFSGCSSIRILKMPCSLFYPNKTFGQFFGTWYYNGSIAVSQNVNGDKNNKAIYYIPSGLEEVILTEGDTDRTWIPAYSFLEVPIKRITLPKNLISIQNFAFSYTKLSSIVIPDGVFDILDYAFYRCDLLRSVVIPYSMRTIESNAFDSCHNLTLMLKRRKDFSSAFFLTMNSHINRYKLIWDYKEKNEENI